MDRLASPNTPSMVIAPTSPSLTNSRPIQGTGAPFIRIVEQPAPRALRFRYECEGRSAGSIPGANSSAHTKTHPTIQIVNYVGPAVVVVSCVTKDGPPYKTHPHNLVGREGCKKGVCTMVINTPDMMCSFTSLGIQCVKKKDIDESLRLRESIKVDPFKTGFAHRSQTSNIDLNVVRLCFQVFLQGTERDKYNVPLQPVVSEAIFDKKALCELVISKLSHHAAPVCGGMEIILLCDRVTKDDIQIYFYQEHNNQVIWEEYGDFQPSDVHKQFAICFRSPRYIDLSITQPVSVFIQLRRVSDGAVSEPRPFLFMPLEDHDALRHKRQKVNDGCLDRYLREEMPVISALITSEAGNRAQRIIKHPVRMTRIKTEPVTTFMMNCPLGLDPSMPLDVAASTSAMPTSPKINYNIRDSQQPSTSTATDILLHTTKALAIKSGRLTMTTIANMNDNNHCSSLAGSAAPEKMETSIQETVEKFDSLDIGIDYKELTELMGSNLDENLTFNLSASLFDSGNLNGNNLTNVPNYTGSNTAEPTTSTEENLQQISRLHTEISVLNNLCGPSTKEQN